MVSASILREIAPQLRRGAQHLACGHLFDYLAKNAEFPKRPTQTASNALLLAAIYAQFARSVITDLELHADPMPSARRWQTKTEPRSVQIPALSLLWQQSDVEPSRLEKTYAFVEAFPRDLAERALAWAPPIVTPPDRHGRRYVIANHITAVLARYVLIEDAVSVRQLSRAVTLRRNITEIAIASAYAISPFYDANIPRIAVAASSLEEATLLTGKSRAWCAKKRRSD